MSASVLATPPDPWAQERLFAHIEQPHSSIAFAVVGLIDPWYSTRSHAPAINCLLVSSDGMAMALIRCERGSGTLSDFWSQVAARFQLQRESGMHLSDSLQHWRQWETWISAAGDPFPAAMRRHYAQWRTDEVDPDTEDGMQKALVHAQESLQDAVDAAASRLSVDLAMSTRLRPSLAFNTACHLLRYAESKGESAKAYMVQALQVEALGTLNAAAAEVRQGLADGLAHVICSGASLPDAMRTHAVPVWLHRRTFNHAELREINCDGALWMEALRCFAAIHSTPLGEAQCQGVALIIDFVQRLCGGDCAAVASVTEKAFERKAWAATGLSMYEDRFTYCCEVMKGLAGWHPPRSEVMQWLLNLPTKQVCHTPRQAMAQAAALHFLGVSIEERINAVLITHPGVPSDIQARGAYQFKALNTLEGVLQTGKWMHNCLEHRSAVIEYILSNTLIFEVEESHSIRAVIAVQVEPSEYATGSEVSVCEVMAARGTVANAVLLRDAWELAACLSGQEYVARITSYLEATARLRTWLDRANWKADPQR